MKEKILILGGTEFVGRLLVESLLEDDTKEIFLFNRGKTNPDLFPDVQRIIGDRESDDIAKIHSHKWDYIIDFSSYFPKSLQKTLQHINKDVKKYIYISTISVYDFVSYDLKTPITEAFQKVTCNEEEAIDKTMKTYGKKKMACEQVLNSVSWLNSIILRPSVIYGKYDPTDRFYYWLKKIKTSQNIVIPNDGTDKLSLTYADDLVKIILKSMTGIIPNGTYNCSTLPPISFNQMLSMMKEELKSICRFHGLDTTKLKADGIWLPLSFIGNIVIDNTAIQQVSDVAFTSFQTSLIDQIKYYESKNWSASKTGMSDATEVEVLRKHINDA